MAISLLKLTIEEPVSKELIDKDAKLPSTVVHRLLRKLQNEGLIYLRANVVEATSTQRVKLAVFAVQAGADLERVSRLLHWKEFEAISAAVFEQNGYETVRNLHFKHGRHRFEIDLVGCKGSLAVCVDCKHWQRGLHQSTAKRIVEEQIERTSALAESLPSPSIKIKCLSTRDLRFTPVVLSLVVPKLKFCDNVPIVPVLQLQDFIGQLPAFVNSLKYFKTTGSSLTLDS